MSNNADKLRQRLEIRKYLVFAGMFLLFLGAIWFIFAPSEEDRRKEEKNAGFNTELPDPRGAGIEGDKIAAYEQADMKRKQAEKMRTLGDFSGISDENSGTRIQLSPDADDKESSLHETGRREEARFSSVSAYNDINRTLGNFYESPQEDPEKEALKAEVEQLKQAGVSSVAVSIDGPEDVHDAGRQAGSFKRAMEAVRALTAAGMPVSVISTLRRDCMGRLEELYRVLEGSGIGAWQLQACSPMGNAARGLDWRIDPAEVIAFVMRHRAEAPFMLGAADNVGYFTDEELRLRGADGACFQGCRAGISAIGIDSAGNVRGCESLYDERFNEGNLRQRRLRDIWEDPGAFAYNRQFRREMLTGTCARCRMGPWCAGGCRSYNYFVHGKLYESPACAGGAK